MKTCTLCKVPKPLDEFYRHRRSLDGLKHRCKRCSKASLREYSYGISTEQFNDMLAEQGNSCAICRDTDKKWCVDHDHATGKVRSILCYCCNIAIGNLGDSARIATAAAEYLTRHGKP